MDNGLVSWPKNATIDVFKELLNEIHPSLKFYSRKREKMVVNKNMIPL